MDQKAPPSSTTLKEDEKKIQIFWDIENCSVPKDVAPFKIARNIISSLGHVNLTGNISIHVYGNLDDITRPIYGMLSRMSPSIFLLMLKVNINNCFFLFFSLFIYLGKYLMLNITRFSHFKLEREIFKHLVFCNTP